MACVISAPPWQDLKNSYHPGVEKVPWQPEQCIMSSMAVFLDITKLFLLWITPLYVCLHVLFLFVYYKVANKYTSHSILALYAYNVLALMQKHSSAFPLFTLLQDYYCAAQYFKVTAGGTSDLCSFLSVQSDTSCSHGSLSAANVGFSAVALNSQISWLWWRKYSHHLLQ